MKHEKDSLKECLFSSSKAGKLRNMKFFRGNRDLISEEEFRAQVAHIEEQKANGTAVGSKDAPRSERPAIDVRAFVADI